MLILLNLRWKGTVISNKLLPRFIDYREITSLFQSSVRICMSTRIPIQKFVNHYIRIL